MISPQKTLLYPLLFTLLHHAIMAPLEDGVDVTADEAGAILPLGFPINHDSLNLILPAPNQVL